MKFKHEKSLLVNISFISTILLADIVCATYIMSPHFFDSFHNRGDVNYGWYEDLKPIDPEIDPKGMSYNQYNALKEKTKLVRQIKNGDYFNKWSVGFGGILGTGLNYECDTCTIWYNKNAILGKRIYSIDLQGWRLNSTSLLFPGLDSVIFHVENGQSYIRKAILSAPIANKDGSTGYQVHMKDIPVKFRYSNKMHWLRIPVSENTALILKPVLLAFSIAYLACLLCLIIIFVRFMIDLIKGYTFTDKNIDRLTILACTLIGYPLCILLLNLVIRLIFNNYFIPDVVFNTAIFYPKWVTLHVGLIFLLLLSAFKQGKKLKDEQDLTV